MRQALYISVLVSAFLLGTVTSRSWRVLHADKAAPVEIPPVKIHEKFEYISLSRHECHCLDGDYSLMLSANGQVFYVPPEYHKASPRWGKLPSQDYDHLSAVLAAQDFWNLKGAFIKGSNGVCVQAWGLTEGNVVCGDPAKVPLTTLAHEIDSVAKHIVWDTAK